ncbi:TonB-dependent receptor plug domain-containing protein [Phaeocystidibacter marisrubri]|uniref:TonB-dependent receptor plug domain-containing protein n=1 Tax=Phaeocystidibacter marisrubri TaxID=1577780 RepID=A0A6L3ZJU8_9FLAO|nr:TonB-dependent receptor [Phaeocystidibacter marisrubri]KAB2817685.1 TonB-dependent receptor plug domain-containing protein [Phaeocystidibacter marisrubri]GGH74102.1 TonB-dependent receptor [Phaeocystidibacter marisrubri]
MKENKYLHIVGALFLGITSTYSADAQEELSEVTIEAPRFGNARYGSDERIDTLPVRSMADVNLAESLAGNSSIYIRSYGPGLASTISFRGYSPSQTAVYWNGMPLNSPALGLTDLSTLPLDAKVEIDAGAAGSLNGSSYMGGALQVYSNKQLNNDLEVSNTFTYRTSGLFENRARISFKTKQVSHHLGTINQWGPLDFEYTDLYGDVRERIGSDQSAVHLTYEGNWMLENRQLTWGFWGSTIDRGIPKSISQTYGPGATQYDDQTRAYFRYEVDQLRYGYHIQTSNYWEDQRYVDPTASLNDTNLAWAQYSDASFYYHINESLLLTTVLDHAYQKVKGSSKSTSDLHRMGAGVRLNWTFAKDYLILDGALKVDHQQSQTPLLPSVGLKLNNVRGFHAQASYRQHFRFPTLNDLYWTPGGNINLSPELGYTVDIRLKKMWDISGGLLSLSVDPYYSQVEDYILWVSVGPFYSPMNVRKVELYGGTVGGSYASSSALTVPFVIGVEGSWNSTKTLESTNPSDPTLGNQLIYTPEYRAALNASVKFLGASLWMRATRTSNVHTTTDNNPVYDIPGYNLIDLGVDYTLPYRSVNVTLGAAVLNATNEEYSQQRFYPMPGIQGNLSVKFQFKYHEN